MENIEEQFKQLKKNLSEEKNIEINKLKTTIGQLEHQKKTLQERLEPLIEYETLCKQVDSWKEKELTVTVKSKTTTKNLMAFAKRYNWEVDFLVESILNNLFISGYGRSVLGTIVGRIIENVKRARETSDTQEVRTAAS
jgi:predicted nuclease with TOPRIM domain